MRLPRWLVVLLIAAMVLLSIALGGWWWSVWPSRTLHEFAELTERGRFDEANRFLKGQARWTLEDSDRSAQLRFLGRTGWFQFEPETWQTWCTRENLEFEPRTISDVIAGRQRFSFHGSMTTPFFIGGYSERGGVYLRCEAWATGR
jgi:hypothetical protein